MGEPVITVDGIAFTLENLSESDEHLRWVIDAHRPVAGKSFCPVCGTRAPCDMVSLAASGLARSAERDAAQEALAASRDAIETLADIDCNLGKSDKDLSSREGSE